MTRTRHILSLSGGKDSAALAVYMRDKVSDMEYIFHDTEMELPETYEYLARLEAYLGKPTAIIAPWQPLRLSAIGRKARLVGDLIRRLLELEYVDFGDGRLFFRDLVATLT
ncbi:MAG: phosphoadenosine phosphosulfate reductase family protein, partial [Candidatus Sulfotelmatobacter sp.]